MQAYSNPKRASDPYALPNIEVFQLTAMEAAEQDEDEIFEYLKRPEFRLATMDSKVRERMLETMVEELEITGGWYWWACFPGCLPDSNLFGPFDTEAEALADAREGIED